jgi:hypothetical protein
MSELNLEIWKPEPIIPSPGDYVSRFNRYYLCINPNAAEGPPTWRVSDPDEFPCDDDIIIIPPGVEFMVIAQAPMVVTGDHTAIDYSFSLEGVPEIDTSGTQLLTSVDNLGEPVLLTNRENDPVKSVYDNNDKTTVTTFDIYGLLYEEFSRASKRTMRVTVYNSNRSTPITSSDPVQSAGNVASTDLFFDISSLPHTT